MYVGMRSYIFKLVVPYYIAIFGDFVKIIGISKSEGEKPSEGGGF